MKTPTASHRRLAVSILLPVFNQATLLSRAVESVLGQTVPDWELVIVNDGSTDSTAEVALTLARGHKAIRFLDQPHGGVSQAINCGFTATSFPYLTTLAADDYYKPNHVEDNLRYLAAHPEADLVIGKTEILGDPYVVDLERPGKMIHIDRCACGGTFFVRREVFQAVGGRPPVQYGTDYLFFKKVEKAGYSVHRRDTRTYVYDRTLPDSITKEEERSMISKSEF
jgi:glycosyltransferase involved in cell wall biosynthesis